MTKEEYITQRNELLKKHESELKVIAKEFAFSNNPYKIGDIITDHVKSIKIQQIQWSFVSFSSDKLSECVYKGIQLLKNGKPSVKKTGTYIYQSNIVK